MMMLTDWHAGGWVGGGWVRGSVRVPGQGFHGTPESRVFFLRFDQVTESGF